jgi:transcriptional regulator with XRE-family HTH domain
MDEKIMDLVNQQCGQKIRILREARQLLQRELGEKAGLPERTIGRIERGEVDVRIGTLKKIADALGVSLRDFFQ